MSSFNSFLREVEEGGATNRHRTFILQSIFFMNACSPLYAIFPVAPLALNVFYYGSLALLGFLNLIANICHKNQMYRNHGEDEKVHKLPFGLHHSPLFSKIILSIANHVSYPIGLLYVGGLVATLFYIGPLMAYVSTAVLLVNACFQKGWFPKILEKPYFLLVTPLMIVGTFGVESKVGIVLTAVNIAFFIYDYIQTNMRGVRSATIQFPIAEPTHHMALKKELEHTPKGQIEKTFKQLVTKNLSNDIRLTFNHLKKANNISNKLLGNAPLLKRNELEEYERLFDSLNFQNPSIREGIVNELVVHDNFNKKSIDEHRQCLQLPDTCSQEDVSIGFLKSEIKAMVNKLSTPDYRGMNAEQISTLYGHVRLLLTYLKTNASTKDKEVILLSLALRTGAQCWRVYLDEFTKLGHQYSFTSKQDLSLRKRAILAAQTIRDNQFQKYYYDFSPVIKKISFWHKWLWSDTNEYHTYEDFSLSYGRYFYLRNPSLSIQTRDMTRLLFDRFVYYVFPRLLDNRKPIKALFSDYYNQSILVDNVLEGELLAPIFEAWCHQISPTLYKEEVLDEYHQIKTEDARVKTMIKMMLVDLGLAEYTKPYEYGVENSVHAMSHLSTSDASYELKLDAEIKQEDSSAPLRLFDTDNQCDVTVRASKQNLFCNVL